MAAMNKAGGLLFCAFFAGSAVADWQLVGTSATSDLYADRSSIRKEDNRVGMVDLIDFRERQFENERFFQSVSVEVEYDCKENRFRELSLTRHAYRMGDGETTPLAAPPATWEPIPPGSGTRLLADVACGKAQKVKAHKKNAKGALKNHAPR